MRQRRSGWLMAWIGVFFAILLPLIVGAYATSGTEAALQMVFIGGIYVALPLSFFALLVFWTFVVVPRRQRLWERGRERVGDRTPVIEVSKDLRPLPNEQLGSDRRQITHRPSGR